MTRNDATTNLIVKNVQMIYTNDNTNCGNGDILLGDGRYDASEPQGKITLSMNGTAAEVMTQQAGYYDSTGDVADNTKAQTNDVAETDTVTTGKDGELIVDDHSETRIVNQKDATCTEEGYTGDKVCTVCGKVVEQGKVIEKLAHNYKDGKCTVCGAADPNYKPSEPEDKPTVPDEVKPDVPETGDSNNVLLWIVLLFVSGVSITAMIMTNEKRWKVK